MTNTRIQEIPNLIRFYVLIGINLRRWIVKSISWRIFPESLAAILDLAFSEMQTTLVDEENAYKP